MVTLSRGIRGRAGGFPRAVTHLVAAALAVTATFAAVWAGPLPSASAGSRPPAASASPALVKFYIVPPPGNGRAQSLFTIAASTLGDGSRYMEIFSLNKGRLQPNGGRLTSPQLIEPGWILRLPADAAGPGVRFGLLPVVTAPAPHRPSRPGGTASGIMIGGALLAFLAAGLVVWLIRPRTGSLAPRWRPSAAGTQRRPAAIRPAAEGDAAELRAALTEMQAELGRVTAYVVENLHSTAMPATPAAARPETPLGTSGAARQTTKFPTRPAGPATQPPGPATQPPGPATQLPGPATQLRGPAARPAIPAAKPARRSRQFLAMRLSVLAMMVPVLFGLIAATTQLALHGYGYFVFRPAGTGATQQGPSGRGP